MLLTERNIEAGIFLADKPAGISSFKVVSRLRRILGIKKVGHAGTLDPFATGLLVLCAGRTATKLIDRMMTGEKEYLATLRLGIETTTQDPEGQIIATRSVGAISNEQIEACLASFAGEQLQQPPAFSALKYHGKPLYFYARKGIEIKKEPRLIEIKAICRVGGAGLVDDENAEFSFRVTCSKGTYIRALAADIGQRLGCGGYLVGLRRMRSGRFAIDNSLTWDDLSAEDAYERCCLKMINVSDVWKLLQ